VSLPRTRGAALIVAGLFACCCQAQTVECPAMLPVQQSLSSTGLEPWVMYDTKQGAGYNFYDVTFSDGPPQNRVFLTPSKTIRSQHSRQELYDFKALQISVVWLLCLYRDTSIGISRKLDPAVGSCRVTYDPKTGFRSVLSIDCK
jgi:hypothetical protein